MDEPQRQLRDNLEKLHDQIQKTQAADAQTQQRLEDLKQHVEGALAEPAAGQPHPYHSLRERLTGAIEHFEDTHAELTLTIGEVLNNLAAIGL
jgi:regulator of replication initiation timing